MKTKYPGVERQPDGRYRLRVTYLDPRTGKRKNTVRLSEATSARAAADERAALTRQLATTAEAPPRQRVGDVATSWLKSKLSTLRPSTASTYALALDHLDAALGDFYLDALTLADLSAWRDSMKGAPITVNGRLRVTKTMLADVCGDRGIASPAARLRCLPEPVRSDEDRNVLSLEEVRRVLKALRDDQPQWYPLIATLVLTGLRFGEATALEWSDILDDRILVSKSQTRQKLGPTKTRARRSVALPPELAEILREHRLDLVTRQAPGLAAGMVFPSAVGTYLYTPGVRKALRKALATAGVTRRTTIHGMRRTLNNELRKRVPGDVVRSITGHTGEDMTEHYSHVALEEKQAALATLGVAQLVGKTSDGCVSPSVIRRGRKKTAG